MISAYNAEFAPDESTKVIASGYVVRADRAYALYIPSDAAGPAGRVYFDSAFTLRFIVTHPR